MSWETFPTGIKSPITHPEKTLRLSGIQYRPSRISGRVEVEEVYNTTFRFRGLNIKCKQDIFLVEENRS